MSRIILVAMVLAVTVAGCNRFPDNGLQISANLLPDDSCFVAGDQEERLLRGLYDVGYRTPGSGQPASYALALQVQSYLISNAVEFQGEQGNLQVDNLDITILLPDGTKPELPGLNNPYRVTTSAVLPTTEPGGDPSLDVAFAIGIPASYQDAVVQVAADNNVGSVLLDIRAGGTTFGGFSQRSAPFRWPVDLCFGCLDTSVLDPNCADADLADSCLPGQDGWPYCTN